MKIKIVNLTPHAINAGNLTFPPSGHVARVAVRREILQTMPDIGVPITAAKFGAVKGLPEEAEGTYYIVAALVRQAEPDRLDLLSPGELLRDEQGRVIGCSSFDCNT